jgi:CRP-like cAMP-binding protein
VIQVTGIDWSLATVIVSAVPKLSGKEATLGILGEGEFFGEGGVAGQILRRQPATAMTDCELLQIDKRAMMPALHRERTLSEFYQTEMVKALEVARMTIKPRGIGLYLRI